MTAIINGIAVTMTVDEFIEYQRKVSGVKPLFRRESSGINPREYGSSIISGDIYVSCSGSTSATFAHM